MTRIYLYLLSCLLVVFGAGVWYFSGYHGTAADSGQDNVPGTVPPEPAVFTGFIDRWNKECAVRLDSEIESLKSRLGSIDNSSRQPDAAERADFLTSKRQLLQDELAELEIIRRDSPSLARLDEADLPDGLQWQNGMDHPDIGDPGALKGGHIRLWNPSRFPSTLRPFGPNSKNYFNYSCYDNVEMRLVYIHPATGGVIPGLADRWAVAADGRTVYFHIDERARYSDGRPVLAGDYLLNICLRTSRHADDPYYLDIFRHYYSAIRTYGDRIVAITIPRAKPCVEFLASKYLYPANPAFYAEFDASYVVKYQWRVPPTTGGYTIGKGGVDKGRSITMRRVSQWWAGDIKYHRHTCNVDAITHLFIEEEGKAFEMFRRGEIDAMTVHKPENWNEKLEMEPVFNGYVRKVSLHTRYPRAPYGLYINAAVKPVDNLDVRWGFQHAMNMSLVLDRVFQGDLPRPGSYASGYGIYTNDSIKPPAYSPGLAREYFARAGYRHQGADGILRNDRGERLEIELNFINMSTLMASVCKLLKQYALPCGLDLKLEPLESSVCSRRVFEKRHQVAFWAWPLPYPLPELSRMFHSSQVYDDAGRLVPYTDNIMSVADADMDNLLMRERRAATVDEYREATWRVQQKLHDLAVWVPGWEESFVRVAFWRWICWPDTADTRFCYPAIYDPLESHLYWIDPALKKETLDAREKGATFPEYDETVSP